MIFENFELAMTNKGFCIVILQLLFQFVKGIFIEMKKVLNILKNKYLITIVALTVWISFFDKNDISEQMDLSNKVNKLKVERDYYVEAIKANKNKINELQTDSKSLEKFARENYLMKKDNEDVFVIVTQK